MFYSKRYENHHILLSRSNNIQLVDALENSVIQQIWKIIWKFRKVGYFNVARIYFMIWNDFFNLLYVATVT